MLIRRNVYAERAVCDNANENCSVFPGRTERIHWGFEDPAAVEGDEAAARLSVLHRVWDEIREQFLDQLRVALIEFAPFDAIDELLDLGRISGGDVIVVFHRRRSRRSYAKQKRTPRPERKYFLFSRGFTAGTRSALAITEAPCRIRRVVTVHLRY